MVSSTTEESGRFNPEVADLLLVTVDNCPTVLVDDTLILLLDRLFLLLRLVLTDFGLLGKILGPRGKDVE